VGKGSECTLVESYGGPAHDAYFTNAVTEVRLEDAAVVDHYTLERQGLAAAHVAVLAVAVGRDARYTNHALNVGGALARSDVDVLLGAPGADAQLQGLFLANFDQHMDTHTLIDHAQPHGTSREIYKGILNGNARGVFYGRVLVRKDAQKTDAQQTNKNLLLSKDALVHSTPQLEILADDVKCKHGSTTGQLDEGALFYLRSRGISPEEATRLLTFAFASDLVSRIRVAPVRISLEAFLHDRLTAAPKQAVA
jgi:Fe-S cluster assembly protein SufD